MRSHLVNRGRDGRSSARWVKLLRIAILLLGSAWSLWPVVPAPAPAAPNASDAQILGVWPPPPAEARVHYVQSIASPTDLGIRPSGWRRFANAFTGADKGKETLVTPCGLALDEEDNLWLTDTGAAEVWSFDRKRKKIQRWEKAGKTRFISPVAVAKRKDTVFVADSGLGKVLALSGTGKLLFEITDSLERPAGLAIAGDRLFVADAPAHRIAVFTLRGKLLSHIGKRGSAPGELNFPTHLAADGQGQLFVTDSMNSRIQIFTVEGVFQTTISGLGDSSGHLSRPKGVAVDREGHLFIVDALFDNFQIFDQQGRFLLDVGSQGSKPGQFWLPAGISISRTDQIFVADSYNHRVQVFQFLPKP